MSVPTTPLINKRPACHGQRVGFHYFPDTLHYREADLQTWLPELAGLGAGWLVLRSETGRAIPEHFLRGLKSAGIEPLIQFDLPLDHPSDPREQARDLAPLLEVYARWGARYVIFFDRPNARGSWSASAWAQQDLVERFLDRYLPLADLALRYGLNPLFPPLEPGGSYWDTAFLRSALQALQRRKQENVLRNLVLCAYAWSNGRSLDWGGGGPERWPEARPYNTPINSQDQRGFRIFEWYLAVTRSVLERDCPVVLLQAALPGDTRALAGQNAQTAQHAADCLAVVRLLGGEKVSDPQDSSNELDPIPPQVMACNFWLLSVAGGDAYEGHGWFAKGVSERPAEGLIPVTVSSSVPSLEGNEGAAPVGLAAPVRLAAPVVMVAPEITTTGTDRLVEREAAKAVRAWMRERPAAVMPRESDPAGERQGPAIRHYLLLPGYEWGVSDWYLEIIRPFVKKYRPTVGFSVEEAAHASRVTVVGNAQNFPEDLLIRLRLAGCAVEQISGDGARIATVLAEW